MKPRLFIGSSTEGKSVADAIHTELQGDAECTVWTQGVFGLSESNTESLMKQVKTSEFGVFVFSADDTVKMRGALFSTPRDNVVYELGLFSGALGPERCFFVTPKDTGIHLPTDLMGMTAGWYETGRQDKEMQPAVGPFCNNVRRKINETTFGIDFIHPDNNTSLSSGKHILTCKCNVYPGSDILLFVQNQHRWYPKRDRFRNWSYKSNLYDIDCHLGGLGLQTIHLVKTNDLGKMLIENYLGVCDQGRLQWERLKEMGISEADLKPLRIWYPPLRIYGDLPPGLFSLANVTVEVVPSRT